MYVCMYIFIQYLYMYIFIYYVYIYNYLYTYIIYSVVLYLYIYFMYATHDSKICIDDHLCTANIKTMIMMMMILMYNNMCRSNCPDCRYLYNN